MIIGLKNTRNEGWVKGKIRTRYCSFFLKKFSPSVFLFQEKDHNSEDEDEDKYADDIDMPGQNFDSKRRITVRNLRIREDIAKYLRNLDPNSAYYDPKTRAMRENPYANAGKNPDE